MLIDLIAGARPNFMKISPIIKALEVRKAAGGILNYRLVHTGQHYDQNMSASFFDQLDIPAPDVNLEVGSGTQAEQTATIMIRYEKILQDKPPKLCLVVGDVNSTMACAIVAKKLCIPVAHVEGGIRSGDWTMPEEINRIVTDSISNWFFTTSHDASENLRNSGISENQIFFVGNTMVDTLLENMQRLKTPSLWDVLNLAEKNYFLITLHRPSNVDNHSQFLRLLKFIGKGARDFPVIYPIHPRSVKTLKNLKGVPKNIYFVDPLSYLEFNYLSKHSKAVITDSGGITEETTIMGVPCMTLRDSTERPETVRVGTNELLGTNPENIGPAFDRLFLGRWKKGKIPELWDGKSSQRIVMALEHLLT